MWVRPPHQATAMIASTIVNAHNRLAMIMMMVVMVVGEDMIQRLMQLRSMILQIELPTK
jgi:hypothetical protein